MTTAILGGASRFFHFAPSALPEVILVLRTWGAAPGFHIARLWRLRAEPVKQATEKRDSSPVVDQSAKAR